jgi:imidazoleglycerol phosphate synthase glutamine amidotransferase subunit HisH
MNKERQNLKNIFENKIKRDKKTLFELKKENDFYFIHKYEERLSTLYWVIQVLDNPKEWEVQ